jgi:isopenicillin N synthase-like dioxygenase
VTRRGKQRAAEGTAGLVRSLSSRRRQESYEIGSDTFARQPNVWLPEDVLPGFRAFMLGFYWRCFETAKQLLRALAVGIGLDDEEYFLRFHSGENNQLRLLHYPPVETEKLESRAVARMPAHSDWGSITMLFQDGSGGLQVEDPGRPGCFVDAKPLEDALIVNVGDLLMRWSNGRPSYSLCHSATTTARGHTFCADISTTWSDCLKSTLHRVTAPPVREEEEEEKSANAQRPKITKARYSIPYFVAPDPTAVVECLPQCAGEGHPPKYEPIMQDDYRRMRAKTQY